MKRFGIPESLSSSLECQIIYIYCIRTYRYFYMRVYRVRVFAHARLRVHGGREQLRVDLFPYIRLFQLSFIIRKYVQNIS